MRLINADKAIEQLEDEEERSSADFSKYADEIGAREDDDWHFEGLKRAIEIVKAEEQLERSDWIPTIEELPDPGQYVLASFENEMLTLPAIARYEVDENGNGAFFPDDSDVAFASVGIYVNAWMPLPKLYRKEENNE